VSRASFYQHFEGVEDCFWRSYREYADQVVGDVRAATRHAGYPELALARVLTSLAATRPGIAQLLVREGLAAGPKLLAERERLVAALQEALESAPGAPVLDIPPRLLIGGVFRFLSQRLEAGEPMDAAYRSIEEWALTFAAEEANTARPCSESLAPALPPLDLSAPARPPRPSTAGTARERIITATAQMIGEVGYRSMTVGDIAATAGVSRRGFYHAFATRQDAVIAAYEDAFATTVAACTPAFFAGGSWPERVWGGARAFTRCFIEHPQCAYIGFVECYSLGKGFVPRVHETQLAFTIFLEDGYRQRPEAQLLSRSCSDLTAATIFEAGFQATLRGVGQLMRAMQPLAVYMALTPFLGRDAAAQFVRRKIGARSPRAARGTVLGARLPPTSAS
jgi:AcrR family transcriptional regulator